MAHLRDEGQIHQGLHVSQTVSPFNHHGRHPARGVDDRPIVQHVDGNQHVFRNGKIQRVHRDALALPAVQRPWRQERLRRLDLVVVVCSPRLVRQPHQVKVGAQLPQSMRGEPKKDPGSEQRALHVSGFVFGSGHPSRNARFWSKVHARCSGRPPHRAGRPRNRLLGRVPPRPWCVVGWARLSLHPRRTQ